MYSNNCRLNSDISTFRPRCIQYPGISNQSLNPEIRNMQANNTYHNPYEYGARQNSMGMLYKSNYIGPYDANPEDLCQLGGSQISYEETFPGAIRNINIESSLLQKEMTHLPGQRTLTEIEINRFELLPFDPQDTRHIVWSDNMPRGGVPSRIDRLELI